MQILVIILGLAGGVSDKTLDPTSIAINHIIKGVYDETRVKTVETFKEKYAPDFMDQTRILE
jgi:hypothetical protein|tara:strand:- start:685 stop:870 length:186 start_codon:yes stop_codon:yes gene_type:complete